MPSNIKQSKLPNRKWLFIAICLTILIIMISIISIPIFFPQASSTSKSFYDIHWIVFVVPTAFTCIFFGLVSLARNLAEADFSHFIAKTNFEYTKSPSNTEGFDITIGSVIAHGQGNTGYSRLISGIRNHYSFRTIEYSYYIGEDSCIQTIICIDLKQVNLTPFSIIKNDYTLLDHAQQVRKFPSEKYVNNISRNYSVMVSEHHTTELEIPIGILKAFSDHSFASKRFLNAEYLGDRLLVYRYDHPLTKSDFLLALDDAITLAQKFG